MVEGGFNVCTNCGKLGARALDTRNVVYNHLTSTVSQPYSRKSRFDKKVIRLLRCLVNYEIDEDLLYFLQHRKIKSPKGLHRAIKLYPTK
jgi:hypothetical protein